jgi:acyl dehydratase
MSASGTVIEDLRSLKEFVGREVAVTDWLEVTQQRINQFAEVTQDRQWIHVDRERAHKESPHGTTIGHGFLTLSLLSHFLEKAIPLRSGVRMSVNYGLNRVRFPAPVLAGSRIRARFAVPGWKESADYADVTYAITVETEGGEKPCCVAEWVVRYYF